jgi:cysteine desulfurase
MKRRIYFDHNATTPLDSQVLEVMLPYLKEEFGNPSSVHSFGQRTRQAIEQAREIVAKFLNAQEVNEIVFTSGGTESNNFAIKGISYANREKGNHLIISSIEHHAVLNVCQYLEKQGFQVTYLPVDKYGRVNPLDIEKAIKPETILVTIMHANNEVGTIQPISEIGQLLRRINQQRVTSHQSPIYFHTDAVQTVGKVKVDVQELNVDLLSLSAHKFYGPKGIGALYIRKGTRIHSLLQGGHHEKNRRAGTENVAGIVGLAEACKLAISEMDKEATKLLFLRKKLEEGINKKIPYAHSNGHPEERLPNTVNFSFEGLEGESLILSLDFEGIAASTGSACTSGSLEPSHILLAMGVPAEIAQGSIRFSLGRDNTEEEIDYLLEILPKTVSRLRSMSPLWEDKLKSLKR